MIKRVLSIIPVLLMILFVLFFIVQMTPGSPATAILGLDASAEDIQALNQALGYDKPLLIQYFNWVIDLIHGDLGYSIFMKQSVLQAIQEHIIPTLRMSGLALAIAIVLSVPIGIVAAYRNNSLFDQIVVTISLFELAIPSFVLALFLMLFFGNHLKWLPVAGYKAMDQGFWESTRYLILPATAIGIVQSAQLVRITRSSMINALNENYIKTARAKGARELRVVVIHAFRNAGLPLLTTIGQSIGLLIAGSVVVEYIFVIPGMGQLMLNAIKRRDFPVIQGVVFVIALIYLIMNLIIDLLYCVIDQRVKLEKE